MKRLLHIIFIVWMIPTTQGILMASGVVEKCPPHRSFSPLTGYHIVDCVSLDSASFTFPVDPDLLPGFGNHYTITGRFSAYSYKLKEGNDLIPALLIFRAMEDSLRNAFGIPVARKIMIGDTGSYVSGRIARDNFQTWVYIKSSGTDYHLTFIDKPVQVRFMSATDMYRELMSRDSVTLDILFDDDTSSIIAASMPLIEQLYLMLKEHPDLKISIQSHGAARGNAIGSKIVTANRAKEVLDMMTLRGIDKKRLSSCGWGGDHPIADNRTEEGRALNRRIVIVRK